jgi:hypothetical protein
LHTLFNTRGYARRWRDAGVAIEQAAAHMEAARGFVVAEPVTQRDLEAAVDRTFLCMMVLLGGMLAVATAILATIIRFRRGPRRAL